MHGTFGPMSSQTVRFAEQYRAGEIGTSPRNPVRKRRRPRR